ncbi:MAG TPA: glutamate-cysteine ligase family protein [Glycomyces sp.]|nr:glutamate-cysteine ligase family protein [Glycomyces sp.]
MASAITEGEAADFIGRTSFTTGPSRRVGLELEWLVDPRDDATTAWDLPHGSKVTREAGGQVELSSLPADDLASCIAAVETDQAALTAALAERGQTVVGVGFDGNRDPVRLVDDQRYRAMEAYYDRTGPWGRMVMCGTASIQINLDSGDEDVGPTGLRRRWDLVHRLGPVLVAAFANSPILDGRASGWKSTRLALWSKLVPDWGRPISDEGDLRSAFARYVLDSEVMCRRCDPPGSWTAPPGLTLRSWIRDGLDGTGPTLEDVEYHKTTLFPPVRPRGWLELRMIDQQEGDGWMVPAVLAVTLADDPTAADAAYAATAALCGDRTQPFASVWERAARIGVADPVLNAVVRECFAIAAKALRRTEAPPRLQAVLAAFRERYVDAGRCPADDRLDRLRTGASAPQTEAAPSLSQEAPGRL